MSEINIAIEAARLAGHALHDHYNRPHEVSYKGIIDLVTEMDQESERMVTEILRQSFPEYGILGKRVRNRLPLTAAAGSLIRSMVLQIIRMVTRYLVSL